jgi:hypothetical protein
MTSSSIDWQGIERAKPLPATVANMRKLAGKVGVFMLTADGEECSATPGDYFWAAEDEVISEGAVLVAQRVYLIDPLTGLVAR